MTDVKEILREIPSVDEVLKSPLCQEWLKTHPRPLVLKAIRDILRLKRESILEGANPAASGVLSFDTIFSEIEKTLNDLSSFKLRPLINATGIIIHTNLGRSILAEVVIRNMEGIAKRYSNLEYDIEKGERGKRHAHLEEILRTLTDSESSVIVNNNAAAVLLVLNTMAQGKEVIVSRGELIEIGGSFRIPEVMERSGAVLREVGTTNKTHLRDYESSINERTALLLKVHTSNYRVLGFASDVSLQDMVFLGQKRGIPVMNDLGSGCIIDLKKYGIYGEPTVKEVLKSGVDIVTFSGDKLLGGPQAGIILGKEVYIDRIRKNPLSRAVRIDKLTLSAMEATLREYLDEERAVKKIPTLRMLTQPLKDIERRAKKIERLLKNVNALFTVKVMQDSSQAGGGSLPLLNLPTFVVVLSPAVQDSQFSVNDLEERLRKSERPVIARIKDDALVLDARTIQDGEIKELVDSVKVALKD
ncbi:MAG: L-seryl-tRNA(Sec) selenium transferase [Nitrospirae bacterium]|nr:L-seryl-tRNA(Sec) selenium transferase [Nitrospirota bacterium]